MAAFYFSSVLKDRPGGIALHARHQLIANIEPEQAAKTLKARLPDHLASEIYAVSPEFTFSLKGTLNRNNVDPPVLLRSVVVQHLLCFLRNNAQELGINQDLDAYIDEKNKIVKLTLKLTNRTPPRAPKQPLLALATINLTYRFRKEDVSCASFDPFHSPLMLPLEAALDRLISRFATLHLVRRYPMIFGCWRQKHDADAAWFPRIAAACMRILSASRSQDLRESLQNHIEVLSRSNRNAYRKMSNVLREALYPEAARDSVRALTLPRLPADLVLCEAMGRLYDRAIRPQRFKGHNTGYVDVENELLLQEQPEETGMPSTPSSPGLGSQDVACSSEALTKSDYLADFQEYQLSRFLPSTALSPPTALYCAESRAKDSQALQPEDGTDQEDSLMLALNFDPDYECDARYQNAANDMQRCDDEIGYFSKLGSVYNSPNSTTGQDRSQNFPDSSASGGNQSTVAQMSLDSSDEELELDWWVSDTSSTSSSSQRTSLSHTEQSEDPSLYATREDHAAELDRGLFEDYDFVEMDDPDLEHTLSMHILEQPYKTPAYYYGQNDRTCTDFDHSGPETAFPIRMNCDVVASVESDCFSDSVWWSD